MPLFMDIHERIPEAMTVADLVRANRRDTEVQHRWGVRYLRYWFDEEARKVFCLVQAPSPAAAAAVHHEAHGLMAHRIYRVREGTQDRPQTQERPMSQPFIFVATYTVKEGKLEEFRKALMQLVEFVEANEPRLIAFNFYSDEEGSRMASVQVHPDWTSMEFHMKLVAEHIESAYDYLEKTDSIAVYGPIGDDLLAGLRQFTGSATPLTAMSVPEVGFTRTTAR